MLLYKIIGLNVLTDVYYVFLIFMSYSGIKSMNGRPWAQENPMPKH